MFFNVNTGNWCLCPHCASNIKMPDVDLELDRALCRNCGTESVASKLLGVDLRAVVDLRSPPAHTSCRNSADGIEVRTWTPEIGPSVFVLIVWLLVCEGALYLWPEQRWLTTGQIGAVLLLIRTLAGAQTVLTKKGESWGLFRGLWPLGWTRRFHQQDVLAIRQVPARVSDSASCCELAVELRGRSFPLRFGGELSHEQRLFFLQALRHH